MNQNDETVIICSDDVSDVMFAVSKASQRAMKIDRLMWVYAENGFIWMTNAGYPGRNKLIAKCYPGGRTELRRLK